MIINIEIKSGYMDELEFYRTAEQFTDTLSARQGLEKMIQRYFANKPIEAGHPDDHDCHLVGGGGESGCDHPSHNKVQF